MTLRYNLAYVIVTVIGGFAVGAFLASRIWWLRNLFTPRQQMRTAVLRRAQSAFHEHQLRATAAATGVLIYISIYERMVYVLGDLAISEKFSDADFSEVRDAIIAGLRHGQRAAGLIEGIRLCGEKLGSHFPVQPGDVNELPNELRIKFCS